LVNFLLRRKRENIQNSLVRPLYQEILKSLFLVGALLVDTLIPLEILRDLPNYSNIVLSLVVLGLLLYAEIRMYNAIWGKKGHWSLDKYKTISEKSIEKKRIAIKQIYFFSRTQL
jgi:hypothetical protein